MTAEADVQRDASEVSKSEVLNASANGNCNGNGIAKDDAVVSEEDAVVASETESDLIGNSGRDFVQNNGGGLHLEVKVEECVPTPPPQDQSSLSKAAAEESPCLSDGEMVFEGGDSNPQIAITASDDLQSDMHLKEDASRDLGPDSEHDSIPTPLEDEQVGVGDPLSKEIGDGFPDCPAAYDSTLAERNGSFENGQALPSPVVSENDSFQVVKKLETQVGNGVVSDKIDRDVAPTVLAQEGISDPVVVTNDSVDVPGENGSCENAESCEKLPIEKGGSFSSAAANHTIGNPDVDNRVSLSPEDVSTCSVDDARPRTDAAILNDTSSESPNPCPLEPSKSEIETEGGRAGMEDTLSSFPANGAILESSSISQIEAEAVPIVEDSSSSFQENDAISEPNSKSEVEPESAPIVDDTLSSFPANNAVSKPTNSKSEVEYESLPIVDDTLSSFPANDVILEPNSKSEEFESVPIGDDTLPSCPANDAISEPKLKSEIDLESAPIVNDTVSTFPANGAISEPKSSHGSVVGCEEKVYNDAMDINSGLSNLGVVCAASPPISLADNNTSEASLPGKSATDDKPDSEAHSTSALRNRGVSDDDGTASESRVLNNSYVKEGKPLNCSLDDVQIESDVKSTCQVVECTDGIHGSEASTSSQEVSITDVLERQDKGPEVEKRPFYFLIRIPRYDDETLKEQIQHAQLHVEEKTKFRDAIRSEIQMKRATCKEYFDNFEAARSEERAARDLFKAKRQEIDTVQLMINKVKNAISVEDMDSKIRNMEHTMEHETLPLKEEKQFIREIKQLKQLREQISSSLGKQDEVQAALDQKDHIEERAKVLRKEMDLLRSNLLKAEAVTQAAKKKFNEENNVLNEILSQFRAADAIRQEAYAHLHSLRKQQYDKNKYFWRYKDDAKAANNLALSGDREQLQHFCIDQVEAVMELWNNNDEFRKEYIRFNSRSTLRRLRTSDGRSLGPDEEPPVVPDIVRATPKVNLATVLSTPEQEKQVAHVESEKPDYKSTTKVVQPKIEIAKTKKPVKPASSEIGPVTASGRIEIEDERVEEPKLTKEEEELAGKAEELRNEEEATRLREQRRQEEKAKAKEAQERKKKIAEKSQARAAIRAQKEAEEKEKEGEKRVKKKERKKATTTKATNGINEGESAPELSSIRTETAEEPETREKPPTITKRSQKSSQFTKQTKVKSIPLPLRNRSKRRMQPWMWVLTVVVIFALIVLGNGGSSNFKSLLTKFF